jgi:uncharacterized protein YecT (DUF1311 family)
MNKSLILLALVALLSTNIYAQNSECIQNANTDKDVENCIYQELKQSTDNLNTYLYSALGHHSGDDKTIKNIKSTQVFWNKYIKFYCGNIYEFWQGTSIAIVKNMECNIRVNKYRTFELWQSYLTYEDSTKPVLKAPILQ